MVESDNAELKSHARSESDFESVFVEEDAVLENASALAEGNLSRDLDSGLYHTKADYFEG